MRILVHGRSVASSPGRLGPALAGLAARGHDVRWLGPGAPETPAIRTLSAMRELAAWRPDVTVGTGAASPVTWLGWRARGGALLLGRRAVDFERGSVLEALAWNVQPAYALIEEGDAERVRRLARGVALERVVLWPPGPAAAPPAAAASHPDVEVLERSAERLGALAAGRSSRPAVFVDRDGTLIAEEGYLSDPERVRLIPGVPEALRALHQSGLPVVVVSNQSGVGRGRFELDAVYATMSRLRRELRTHGVELDAIRFCPHAPEAGCDCRKPGTRLLAEAAEDLRLSLAASVMVGDKRIDARTGQAAGGTGLLVRTGYGREEEGLQGPAPDGVFDDFGAAAAWIVERYETR